MHSFKPSSVNNELCAECRKTESQHGDKATCECCPYVGQCEIYTGEKEIEILCPDCMKRAKTNDYEAQQKAIERRHNPITDTADSAAISRLAQAAEIDKAIEQVPDIFNAETVSIAELEKLISEDDSIIDKNWELAKRVDERCKHYRSLMETKKIEISRLASQIGSGIVKLNQLANKLRADQREKLKLSDISYKPAPPKVTRAPVLRRSKASKEEIRKAATEIGVAEFTLYAFMTSMNCSLEDAVARIKKSIADAKGGA